MNTISRCGWVTTDPLYIEYHDNEWGQPINEDRLLFEFLILEGMQAGLSWLTILKKRTNYQNSFYHFQAEKIVKNTPKQFDALMQNSGIIRNRLKINAIIKNAEAYLNIVEKYGSFKDYIWQFVDGQPIINHWQTLSEVPVTTSISDKMSRQLKKDGFKFIGSTICYAYMQAVGMVDDHLVSCFKRAQVI